MEMGPTQALARHVVAARAEHLPAAVRAEAVRTFVNWMGCAVGGARHEAVAIAVATLTPFAGAPQATLLGRPERMDVLNAALVNGVASHVLDFDDTHAGTLIHPAGPVVSAIAALSEHRPASGAAFVNALVLGIDAACRIGRAVLPDHYDVGWHITGSAGVFGAAIAAGKLLGLDERQMAWAIGLAATQPVGLREMFGSMTKSFHPGRAAHNGLTAALLAAHGYTSSTQAIEAERGWAAVTSTHRDLDAITDRLGEHYEIMSNTYKPFACGLVTHPAIDGCIQLREEHGLRPEQVAAVSLGVHPLVLELTGKRAPLTGLDGKFSVYHAAAVALLHGRAGEREFSDACVRDPATAGLRGKVSAQIDPAIAADAAHVEVRLTDGRVLARHVAHAIGSVARPMSDAALDAKATDLMAAVLPAGQAAAALRAARSLAGAPEIGAIIRMAASVEAR